MELVSRWPVLQKTLTLLFFSQVLLWGGDNKGRSESNEATSESQASADLQMPRQRDGDLSIEITGALQQWHPITLTLDGPYAHERDRHPNPFTDYRFDVVFSHQSGISLTVPGYFAADGQAAETSAQAGTKWRVHFSPPLTGKWNYEVLFFGGPQIINATGELKAKNALDGIAGSFEVVASDKKLPDFRARGRLSYVGRHLLQFQGDRTYFLKAGADAPETLLAYADFDGTKALNEKKCPLKTWSAHIQDWREGDPSWQGGKGKGLIGALNYLSSKGCNAFSFLPYNVDGDGSNVWPFVAPRAKLHYDCSKLDQWNIVFSHAVSKGLFLHFKMQETEIDDKRHKKKKVPAALDGGKLGIERRLYCRELVARFGHHLALNWNLGEENTQTTEEQLAMANYLQSVDPYQNHIVVHTYPKQQDKVYNPLLGKKEFTGISLQNNSLLECHSQAVKWVTKSRKSGHPWAVAFDEPGSAHFGLPADPDYPGMPKNGKFESIHDGRKYALWGTLMAGGMGVEYYFGYKFPENDLLCEDWRSRDQSWDYCRHALQFFQKQNLPIAEMTNRDELVGNAEHTNSAFCLAKEGEVYLVYLPKGGEMPLKLPEDDFSLAWFNPRDGKMGETQIFDSPLQAPDSEDWLALVQKMKKK